MFGLMAKNDSFDIDDSEENLDDLEEDEIDLEDKSSEDDDF